MTRLTPILVDAYGRSGSTLMMRLLASSPAIAVEVRGALERRYFSYLRRWSGLLGQTDWPRTEWTLRDLTSLADRSGLIGPPPWDDRPLFEPTATGPGMAERAFELVWGEFSSRAALATAAHHGGDPGAVRYWAEKHGGAWQVDPGSLAGVRVIALVRDPRDVYVSVEAFNAKRGRPGVGRRAGEPEDEYIARFVSRHRERLRWTASLNPEGEIPVFRYEDLVTDLRAQAARLEAWLDVRLDVDAAGGDPEFAERHRSAASVEGSVGRWRGELADDVAKLLTRELGPELAALGY